MLHPGDQVKLRVDELLPLTSVDDCSFHLPIIQLLWAKKLEILLKRRLLFQIGEHIDQDTFVEFEDSALLF